MADITEQAKQYQSNNEISDDAAATALREQNYKSYFNSQLQLANAKAKANKYYQESLEQSGTQASGGSDIAKTMMNNAYMNQFQNNLGNYQTQESQITADNASRWSEEQASKDSNFMTQLNTISSDTTTSSDQKQELINKLLANYGYQNGSMSSASQTAYDSAIQSIKNNQYGTAYDQSGIEEQLGNWGNELYYAIKEGVNEKQNPDNTVMELVNGNGNLAYVYYNNGSYYVINQNQAKQLVNNGAQTIGIKKNNKGREISWSNADKTKK